MAKAAKFRLTAGLHTGTGEATADHCAEALNFFSWQGRLKSRDGMVPVEAIVGTKTTPYVGWANASGAEPSAVANSGTVTIDGDQVYVGASTAFNRALLYGDSSSSDALNFAELADVSAEYWNGSEWSALSLAHLWRPKYDAANDAHTVAPFIAYDPVSLSAVIADTHINVVFDPPDDWAAKTIATQNLYWIRFTWTGATFPGSATVSSFGTNTWVQTTENRILNVTTWKDANGTPHRFIAYLYGDDGKDLRFSLDGTVLTQSTGLQPDGNSEMFGPSTVVDAFYHAATDRLIGRVSGHVWFYAIPGNGQIYNLEADDAALGTPYASLASAGGLRSAIPIGKHVAMHDGRFFVADGQTLTWSAPGTYADIWPNENEIVGGVVDGGGEITGLASIAGVLVVFKRNSIFTVQADSNTSDGYLASPYPAGVGAVGGVAGCGDFCIFVAADGLWMFDGQNVQKLSGAVDEYFFEQLFSSDIRLARAVYHPPLNQYRVFFPSADASDVLDAALYVDLTGFAHQVRGEEQRELSIWPQGKYDADDYFHATALCSDSTTSERLMLMGDKYGVVWEADQGDHDGPTAVQAKAVQSLMGTGGAGQRVLRGVTVTMRNRKKMSVTVKAIPEGIASDAQSQTASTSKSATPVGTLGAADTLGASDTLAADSPWVTRENPFSLRVRQFQVGVYKTTAGSVEIAGFEAEARPAGRRNEG